MMLGLPYKPSHTPPFLAAPEVGLAVGLGFGLDLVGLRRVLAGVDTEESVNLVLGQGAIARGRRHHEVTYQLDLGLEVVICEVVTLSLCRHVPNLRACGPGLHQLPKSPGAGP